MANWENVGKIQGEKGEKGDKGDKGERGERGLQGEKGQDGINAIIEKGSFGDVSEYNGGDYILFEDNTVMIYGVMVMDSVQSQATAMRGTVTLPFEVTGGNDYRVTANIVYNNTDIPFTMGLVGAPYLRQRTSTSFTFAVVAQDDFIPNESTICVNYIFIGKKA